MGIYRFISLLAFVYFSLFEGVHANIPVLKSLLPDSSIIYNEGLEWSPTDYKNQGEVLGFEEGVFVPSKKLQTAVSFWIKIYTELSSSQGLIHDIDNLGVAYEKVDFESINKNMEWSESQKIKERESLVEERKKQILLSLNKLSENTPIEELTDYDRAILSLWEKNGGKSAIAPAAQLSKLRFQLGQSDRMKEAIFLSGRYLPMMEKIFKEEGLPLQLTRLVFVESSFNILARSKVGASGLWQIMPSAARGRLRMNKEVDFRNHPQQATELAAKILKFNYGMLESWPLAVTGYNHGPYGVKRLVEKNQEKSLEVLIESAEGRRFGFASRNFYTSFLAALEVEAKATEYFPGLKKDKPFDLVELEFKNSIYFKDLVQALGSNGDLAQTYNPHLQKIAYSNKIKLGSKSRLMVPRHQKEQIEKQLLGKSSDKVAEEAPSPRLKTQDKKSKKVIVKSASVSPKKEKRPAKDTAKNMRKVSSDELNDTKKYRVTRGDTLYGISRQFGVSLNSLLSLNDLRPTHNIQPGQIILIP